jgi:GTP-binding protein
MLIDRVTIKVSSGMGGRGSNHTFANKPNGGDGGNGADVYFKGSRNIYDLRHIDPDKKYKGENGGDGQKMGMRGANAPDYIISVPLTTEISINNKVVGKVTKEGELFKLLEGGQGGYGNMTTRRDIKKLMEDDRRDNQEATVSLQLKLQSEVIFLGYPNAGKSSMLNELTNSNVKTAHYAFTTLDPQIGMMGDISLMDLPGLIDGTSEGKGLGTNFLNHVQNSRLAVHFISLENENPLEVYLKLRSEIKKIDKKLYDLNELVALTKSDMYEELDLQVFVKKFKDVGINAITTSIIDDKSLEALRDAIKNALRK